MSETIEEPVLLDFLVFETAEEAIAAEAIVFRRGALVAQQVGYAVDAEGIIGEAAGVSEPSAARTNAWDIPRQRADGRWVFLHPKHHPGSADPAYLAFVMREIVFLAEETGADIWFSDQVEA